MVANSNPAIPIEFRIKRGEQIIQDYGAHENIVLGNGDYTIDVRINQSVETIQILGLSEGFPGVAASECGLQYDHIVDPSGEFSEAQFTISQSNIECDLFFNAWDPDYGWIADHQATLTFQGVEPVYLSGLAELEFWDESGFLLAAARGSRTISVPFQNEITIVPVINPAKTVGHVRLNNLSSGECTLVKTPPDQILHNSESWLDDPSADFALKIIPQNGQSSDCQFDIYAWGAPFGWGQWVGSTGVFTVSFDANQPMQMPETVEHHPITLGTEGMTTLEKGSFAGPANHGVRVYCTVSHFSYDDPIVHPSESGRAHLHMFFGNTSTDANTTATSLSADNPRSTCEGGVNNTSSYWLPALFNENNEVVLPEDVVIYYKTFELGETGRNEIPSSENYIQPIPLGLQMLGFDGDTLNFGGVPSHAISTSDMTTKDDVILQVTFPECLSVDVNGEPILQSTGPQVNSHVSYLSGGSDNGCPGTHPYRIPSLILQITYEVLFDTDWYLASDTDSQTKGASLHADYFASWDEGTMDTLIECNLERLNCRFVDSGVENQGEQLPDRLVSPAGDPVYSHTRELLNETDRTPFGDSLSRMLMMQN